MIKDIKELNFPKKDGKQYATLTQATVTLQDMGEKTITSQVKIDGQITPDFSYDWEVEFKGEKYIMPLRQPQGAKENTSLDSVIDLTFQHWAIYQLKRRYFFSIINLEAGTILPDQYDYPISLNLKDFCTLFEKVLDYYYGDSITIDFNPEWEYSDEPSTVTISNSRIWDVLTGSLLNIYGVRWQIEPRVDNNNETEGEERYVIKVGYPMPSVNYIFEYGFDGGLLKVERQVQDDTIRNMIRGRGGDKNLPYRYYKDEDPDNPTFKADPDWVPELAGIPMTQLRGATFRSYIQGWNHKHYKRTAVTSANMAYAPWAWMRGYTDDRFNPVEFVADEFDISLNGYGVVKDSSISRYGELEGALSDNEDIYPTIQGVLSGDHLNFFGENFGRVDQIVAVDIPEDTGVQPPAESVTENLKDVEGTVTGIAAAAYKEITIRSQEVFYIEAGKSGDLFASSEIISVNGSNDTLEISKKAEITKTDYVAVNAITGERRSSSGIPEGTWRFEVTLKVHNQLSSGNGITVRVSTKNILLVKSSVADAADSGWYVWVKNIWGSSKNASETDKEYAERVWLPILGDHMGEEAAIAFSTGLLSTSEDYTFKILSIPEHDESRILNGAKSHWRLRLGKSDADYDVTGKLIPNSMRPANPGEYFFFTGIELPSAYWIWAEERLDNWKKDELEKLKDIRPAWAVTPDKVRLANNGYEGALIDMVKVGSAITIADKRFIPGSQQEILYVQNITYTYNEPTDTEANIIPDISFELSDRYEVVADPTSEMQGEISALQKQIGNLSNVKQSVRKIGDKVYLCKDRKDRTPYQLSSDTGFEVGKFNSGINGGYVGIDKTTGQSFAEVDMLYVRMKAYFEELTIVKADTIGGRRYQTPGGSLKCTEVEEVRDKSGDIISWRCWFLSEQDGEKSETMMKAGDRAICEAWNIGKGTHTKVENRIWWRNINAVTNDGGLPPSLRDKDVLTNTNTYGYIEVSMTDCMPRSDTPQAGDTLVQLGNSSDTSRQSAIMLDTVGSDAPSIKLFQNIDGYTLSGKDIVSFGYDRTKGNAYLHCYGDTYIGDPQGDTYINYDRSNKRMDAKLALSVLSTIDGRSFEQYIQEVSPKVTQESITEWVNNITQGKFDEIQNQIDGAIETFFADGKPTLKNYPAAEWVAEGEEEKHLGDLYYDRKSGIGYRFGKDDKGNYVWDILKDTEVATALAEAAKALTTAEGKSDVKIFARLPLDSDEYRVGDLWVNATYNQGGANYKDDILRCNTAKAAGDTFDIGHWKLASNYIDEAGAQAAIDKALEDYDYLKKALAAMKENTVVNGGLILSSMISLGQRNSSLQEQIVTAGINGIKDKETDIALWLGGKMIDREVPGNENNPDAAQWLARFDGSGYMVGGLLSYNKKGLNIGHGKIVLGTDGTMIFGGGIKIEGGKTLGDLSSSLSSVVESLTGLNNLLVPMGKDDKGNLVALTYEDVANGATVVALKSRVGFYSDSFVSAKGIDPDGNINAGFDAARLDAYLKGDNPDNDIYATQKWVLSQIGGTKVDLSEYAKTTDIQKWVTDKGYLTSVSWSQIGSKPTTLSGYGITDAKIANGTITLGDNSITPLVKHQTIYALTFAAGAFSAKTYTPNAGAQTVNIPTNTSHISESGNLYFTNARAVAALKTVTDGIASSITTLTTKINSVENKVDDFKAEFDKMFTPEWDANGKLISIKANAGLWTDQYLTAKGKNADGSVSGGGGLDVTQLQEYLDTNGYVTATNVSAMVQNYALKSYVDSTFQPKGNYLTSVRTLTIQKNGSSVGTFNPAAASNATINISDVASAATLSSHISDTTIHITATERTKWNKVVTDFAAITGTDSDTIINKWEEVVAFLASYTEADTLAGLLSHKVDKVSGYGLSKNDFTDALLAKLNGIEAGANKYVLPTASTSVKGGVKVGSGLTISSEVLAVNLSASHIPNLDWSKITTGKPTTLGGYGITDAYTKKHIDDTFVTLATAQTIRGQKDFSTDANKKPLLISRSGAEAEAVAIGINDSEAVFHYKNDEYTSYMKFILENTDTENSDGSRKSTHTLLLSATQSALNMSGITNLTVGNSITIGGATLSWDGKALKVSTGFYSDSFISAKGKNADGSISGGGGLDVTQLQEYLNTHGYQTQSATLAAVKNLYLPLSGGTVTGDLSIRRTTNGDSAPLHIGTSSTSLRSGIQLSITTSSFWNIATPNGSTFEIYSGAWNLGTGVPALRLIGNTFMQFNGNNVWHAGNLSKVSQLSNDAGYITSNALADYLTSDEASNRFQPKGNYLTQSSLSGYATQNWVSQQGYLKSVDLSNYVTKNYLADCNFATMADLPSLSGYATQSWVNSQGFLKSHQSLDSCMRVFGSSGAVDWNNVKTNGSYYVSSSSTNKPADYGQMLVMRNTDTAAQLYIPYISSQNIRYRGMSDKAGWFSWKTVLDSSNYASFLDGRYALASSLSNYATVASLNGYAKQQTVNDFVHSSNEWTVIPDGYDKGVLWLNYRAGANGTATNFTQLNIGNGTKGGLAAVVAGGFVRSGGTASQVLVADGTVKTVHTLTSVTNLGWGGTSGNLATINTLAHWNGAYAGTSSNLQYCDRGRFGTMATANAADYLPLTGGTLNFGSANSNLNLNTTNASEVGMRFYLSGAAKGWVGYNKTYGTNLYNYAKSWYFGLKDDGSLYYSGGTVWHSGNDGSGSGLDADLLDGVHKDSFEGYYFTRIDASSLDNNTWYPVVMAIGNSIQTRIRIQGHTRANATWNSRTDKNMALILDYTVNGSNWGWTTVLRTIHQLIWGAGSSGSNCIAGLGQLTNRSHEYVMVRGGAVYDFYISRDIKPTLYTSPFADNGQSVSPTKSSPTPITRNAALITDNVASATKLQTARNIWGQPFNGTGNVDGLLKIQANAGSYCEGIRIKPYNNWSTIVLGGPDLTADTGTSAKTWSIHNNNGNFYINNNAAAKQKATRLWGHANGWTIGNLSTTSYALNVSSFICADWVRTGGTAGWYSQTYGGGIYMNDTSWIRIWNNKNFYGGTAIIRTDGTLQVGDAGKWFSASSSGATVLGKTVVHAGNITNHNAKVPTITSAVIATIGGVEIKLVGNPDLVTTASLKGILDDYALQGDIDYVENKLKSYLPLAGGSMNGVLNLLGNKYTDTANTGSLNLNNSDIYNVNSIKFADLCDNAAEGLQWYRDATHVDSLWVKNGVMYFTPNRAWGGTAANYTIWHSGNLNPANYLPLSGGTITGSINLGADVWISINKQSKKLLDYIDTQDDGVQNWVSDNFLDLGGGTMTGDIILNNASYVKVNGEAGRVCLFNQSGVSVNARPDNGGSVVQFVANKSDGKTALGAACGVFLNANAVQYFYYGGSWDAPLMKLHPSGQLDAKTALIGNMYLVKNGNQPYIYSTQGVLYIQNTSSYIDSDGEMWGFQYHTSSDLRLKAVTRYISPDIRDIAGARAVEFDWLKNGRHDCGCIAQDWQNIIPMAVVTDKHSGMLSMDYGKAALISAISIARSVVAHESRIAVLEREVATLQSENKRLSDELESMKSQLETK